MRPLRPGRLTLTAAVALGLMSAAALRLGAFDMDTAGPLRPAEGVVLEVADQLGGNLGAVAMVDDVIFAGVGPRVVALSAAGTSLQPLGRSELLDGVVVDLAAQGNRVAAITSLGAFVLLDETDPTSVRLLGTTRLFASPEKVALAGETAFVLGRLSRTAGMLTVVDLRDPAAPIEAEILQVSEPFAVAATSRGYGVVLDRPADGHLRLLVVDAKDPKRPYVTATVDLGNQAVFLGRGATGGDVVTAGEMAYVVMPTDPGVVVLDLADPAQPRITGRLELPGVRVALAAQHLYLSQANDLGLPGMWWHHVVDVSDPTRPTSVGRVPGIELPDTTTGGNTLPIRVAAADGRVVMARGGVLGLTTLADPAHEAARTHWTGAGIVDDVANDGSLPPRLYTTRTEGVVGAVSAGTEWELTAEGSTQLPRFWYAEHVAAGQSAGGVSVAYVSSGRGQSSPFGVVDMDKTDQPRLIGTVEVPDYTNDIAGVGDRAVLAVTNSGNEPPLETPTPRPTGTPVREPTPSLGYMSLRAGLRIVDARDPARPRLAGSVFIRRDRVTANAVAIGGTYAYLGTNVGITVVDIADPAAPVIVAQMDLPTNVSSLGAFGDRLLASGNEVVLFDVRDPARPRREGGLTLPAGAPVALDGTYAYGGDGDSVKVFALDASGPADAPVAEIRLAAQPQAIVRDPTSDLLAVAAGAAGLYTLRLRSAPVVPTPTESATPPETRTPDPTPSATATEARPHRVWLPWAASPGPGRVGQALPVAAMRPRRSRGREPAAIRPARRRSRA